MMRYLAIFLFLAQYSLAGMGELTLFIFRDGMPQSGATVLIDDNLTHTTDADGAIYVRLEEGAHRAVINAYEGERLIAHAKQPFAIAAGENTELIVTLSATGEVARIEAETPAGAVDANVSQVVEANLTSGILAGVLVNMEDQKPIEKAKVFVKGSSMTAISDANGSFTLELLEGNHTLSIIHDKFSAQTLTVAIIGETRTEKSIELSPAGLEMEEFVVLVPHVGGSVAALVAEKRNTDAIGDVMGSEQFSKQGDSSAAGALTRAPGMTLVGGKYIYVRGLGDRYSSALFNGLDMPSPEPTKRVVPLDIFPTSVIDSIMIQKTYSADLPANFGGGTILIRSKGVSEEEEFTKLGFSIKGDSDTFTMGKSYKGGWLDFLGYDTTRGIDQSVITATNNFKQLQDSLNGFREGYTAQELKAFAKTFSDKSYNVVDAMIMPSFKFDVTLGKNFKYEDGSKWGYSLGYSLSNENDYTQRTRLPYEGIVDFVGEKKMYINESEYNHGGMFTTSYQNDHDKYRYVLLYLHSASNILSQTYYTDQNLNKTLSTILTWEQRDLVLNQFLGEHAVWDGGALHWGSEVGYAKRIEPGTINYKYNYDTTADAYLLKPANPFYILRSDLNEVMTDNHIDIKKPFEAWENEQDMHFGLSYMFKFRNLDARNFAIDYTENSALKTNRDERGQDIDSIIEDSYFDTDQLVLNSVYSSADFYTAFQNRVAAHATLTLVPFEPTKINFGARYEYSAQSLQAREETGENKDISLITSDFLPALTLTQKLWEGLQFRAGYSSSLSRPDFREFVEGYWRDPVTGEGYKGYSGLKYTTISNYDVRLEYYFDGIDTISLAGFVKDFINPIEEAILPNEPPLTVFRNAKSARSIGLEVDMRKNFGFISSWLTPLFVSGNYAYIDSKVVVDRSDSVTAILTTDNRAMAGQSPYTVNVQFGWDDGESDRSISLMYNSFGERITRLGVSGAPDVYELPFHALDFVWSEKLWDVTWRFKLANILDSKVEWKQADEIIYTYQKGAEISLNASIKY